MTILKHNLGIKYVKYKSNVLIRTNVSVVLYSKVLIAMQIAIV